MSVIHWLQHYSVAFMAALFVIIVVTTYWPGRKSKIEQQGRIPLKDDV